MLNKGGGMGALSFKFTPEDSSRFGRERAGSYGGLGGKSVENSHVSQALNRIML